MCVCVVGGAVCGERTVCCRCSCVRCWLSGCGAVELQGRHALYALPSCEGRLPPPSLPQVLQHVVEMRLFLLAVDHVALSVHALASRCAGIVVVAACDFVAEARLRRGVCRRLPSWSYRGPEVVRRSYYVGVCVERPRAVPGAFHASDMSFVVVLSYRLQTPPNGFWGSSLSSPGSWVCRSGS